MRERAFIALVAGVITIAWFEAIVLFVISRPIRAQPLPLRCFVWKDIGSVSGSVDLDEDGWEELLVEKDGRWQWVKLGEHTQRSLPIPVPEGATSLTPVSSSIAVFGKGDRLWVITRCQNGWQKSVLVMRKFPPKTLTGVPGAPSNPPIPLSAPPITPIDFDQNRVTVTDLDGDGRENDVLVLTDGRTLIWLRRLLDGRFQKQSLKLPQKFERLETSNQNGWNGCSLIGWRTYHWSKMLRWQWCIAGTCSECLSSIPLPPGIPPSIHLPLPLWGVPVPLQLALFLPPFVDPITGMVDAPVIDSVTVKDGHLNLDEGKEFPPGFFWTYADLDGDGKPDSIAWVRSIACDVSIGWVVRESAREEGSILVRLSTTNRQHPLPHSLASFKELVIHDINGDGRMELVGLRESLYTPIPDMFTQDKRLICWRYDPRTRRWETFVSPPIQSHWEFSEPLIVKRNRRLFVFAIKQARIWRWEITARGWQSKLLSKLPEGDDFTWDWTGKRLVLLVGSEVPMLRELLGIYRPRPSRLFSMDENGQWQFLAYVSPKGEFSTQFTESDTDLDGDGEDEIVWQERNLVFVGRFHEGKWQLGKVTLPTGAYVRCSLRIGSNRWLVFNNAERRQRYFAVALGR